MNQPISEEVATLSQLSPAMRRALLSATPPEPEVEWDNPADYCQGHESLRGDRMGASDYCEGDKVCHQAREAYNADRELTDAGAAEHPVCMRCDRPIIQIARAAWRHVDAPDNAFDHEAVVKLAHQADRVPDSDRLVITVSPDVTVGTVVALIGRGLCYPTTTAMREHELTERGMATYHALKALPAEEQVPATGATRRQRERANLAMAAATRALIEQEGAGRTAMAYAHAVAAALESLADSGVSTPASLRAVASIFRET